MIVVHKDTDITEYVSSMSWGGSKSEVARKLELHIVNAPLDKNITPLTINLADPVYLFEDDGKTELFRGFVVERSPSGMRNISRTFRSTAFACVSMPQSEGWT